MQIGDLLESRAISARVTAPGKRQALAVMAEIAARQHGLKAAEVLDALMVREAEGSTGVGHGVAVPHARLPGIERMFGVFLRLEHPVDFDAVDGAPVDLMFGLFAPKGAGAVHLQALARVARMLRQADLREHLRKARSVEAIHALLVQDARSTAA